MLSSLGVAMSGVQKLIGEYASLEEGELLPEMEKADKIVEHPVYGSEDMEALKQCTLIDLEDCMTKDRETGEKGEALCMTFQNEEGKYINVSYLDGQLSISNPYRK